MSESKDPRDPSNSTDPGSFSAKALQPLMGIVRRFFPGQSASSDHSSAAADSALLERWQSTEVDGRRVEWFVPSANASEEPPVGVVLFLHGHGGVTLANNPVFTRLFEKHRLLAVCPEGKRSWWLDFVCPEFDSEVTPQRWLLDTIVPWIEQQFQIQPPKIALLGVSMGGQGALQLAYRHAMKFPVVAAIAPAVDFHQMYGSGIPLDQIFPDAETARQATVVLNLHPLSWPRHQFFCCDPQDHEWFDGAARLGMKLSSSGILHERDLETTAGGHSWDYFNHMAPKCLDHIASSMKKLDSM